MLPSRPPALRVRIRSANIRDVPTLARHRDCMWNDIGEGDAASRAASDRQYRAWARHNLKNGRLTGFIAETPRGKVVGSGCVWLREVPPYPGAPKGLRRPHLLSMYTEPQHRGRGVGERIVRAAQRWCRANGHRSITLHASEMGRPLCAKLGFTRTWEMRWTSPPRRKSGA